MIADGKREEYLSMRKANLINSDSTTEATSGKSSQLRKKKKTVPIRRVKTYKGEWYTINSIFGNDWAMLYALLGGRDCGKSYSIMQWACNRKIHKGSMMKLYWMRLTETACDNLLANGGDKLIDPDLKRKYNLKVVRKNSTIYTYNEVERKTKAGNIKKEKENLREFCEVLACSTFYNTKGVGYFDNEYKGEYLLVLDEMNREDSEKNSFDIVYNFVNLIENLVRDTKKRIRVVMIGNTLDEASDILSAFNFLPDGFGRYKLKSKRAVIDYIMPNESYKERRKGTIADIMLPGASTFTNEVQIDRSLLVNKRQCTRPISVIKFGKSQDTWFTLWNDSIIKAYNNEQNDAIPMRRYLDEVYQDQLVKVIRQKFDVRAYRFVNLSTFKKFQKQMRLLFK